MLFYLYCFFLLQVYCDFFLAIMDDYCPVCAAIVPGDDKDTIECDGCIKWVHKKCADMSDELFTMVSNNPGKISWFCSLCKSKSNCPTPSQFEKILAKLDKLDNGVSLTKSNVKALKTQQAKLSKDFTALKDSIAETIHKQIKSELATFSVELDNLRESSTNLNLKKFDQIESELDKLQRAARRNDVLISGIPIQITNLSKMFADVCANLKFSISPSEVSACFRLGGKNNVVLVRFSSTTVRDQFMKTHRKSTSLRLSSIYPEFKIDSRIYFSDNLSQLSSQLVFYAKKLKKASCISGYTLASGVLSITDNSNSVKKFVTLRDLKSTFSLPVTNIQSLDISVNRAVVVNPNGNVDGSIGGLDADRII